MKAGSESPREIVSVSSGAPSSTREPFLCDQVSLNIVGKCLLMNRIMKWRKREISKGVLFLASLTFALHLGDRLVATTLAASPEAVKTLAGLFSLFSQPALLLPCCVLVAFSGSVIPSGNRIAQIGMVCFCSSSAAVALSLVLKHVIGRARPNAHLAFDPHVFRPLAFHDAFASFPSAQAACAAAVFGAAFTCVPRLKRSLQIFIATLCAARVLSGEHWLSDVMLGWAIGSLCATAVAYWFKPDAHANT